MWNQYTGEKMDPEGMVALLNYREDGTTRKCRPSSTATCKAEASLLDSLFHVLGGWLEGGEVLN